MAKSLNELSNELKEFMIRIQSDVRDKQNAFRPERYNNLKIDMNVARDITPQVRISMGMSEVSYDLRTGDKTGGSLGVNERYVQRWLEKSGTMETLMACWDVRVKNRGKITEVE